MSEQTRLRYRIDSYGDWIKGEGVPIVEDFGIDLFTVETRPWARFGVKGAACHLKGRGDFSSQQLPCSSSRFRRAVPQSLNAISTKR